MHGPAWLARSMVIAMIVALTIALAACGYGDEGGQSSGTLPPGSVPAAPVATVEPTEAPGTTSPMSQSDAEWGPIWDAVPATFPVPDGAKPTEPDKGPVSAAYTVPLGRSTARQVAEFYRDGLDERGYSATLDGPLEDRSLTVWSSNGYGCDALVTILPRGNESLITVLYGTGCGFE
jgi:hypothetical protein